jgi:hypothetical protein
MQLSHNVTRRIGNGHHSGAGGAGTAASRPNYQVAVALLSFLLGSIISTTLVLNSALTQTSQQPPPTASSAASTVRGGPLPFQDYRQQQMTVVHSAAGAAAAVGVTDNNINNDENNSHNPLHGLRILVAIAAFDFSQIPHLEEVLDTYQDLCLSGASKVDVVVHATVAYPVTLIDLWNTRLLASCRDNNVFTLTIVLKSPSLRLHLVDVHRELFYEKIDEYDLFIYTEDDIRVPPRTVGAYMEETNRVRKLVGGNPSRSSDFNVGIVRYEYNYPNNVIIDDKTRHATQNVTRVYWEHGQVR